MLLPVVAVATLAGACWGVVLPGLVNRYSVEWPDGTQQPPWRRGCVQCGAVRGGWWRSDRCPECGVRPTPGQWLTVPLSAAVCGAVAAALGPTPALPAFLLLAAVAVPLALIDLKVLRLPDPLVGTAFVGGVVLLVIAAAVEQDSAPLVRAGLGAVSCGVGYVTLALLPRSQLGFGDVKLGAVLGLYLGWLGWFAVAAGVLLAPVLNLPLVIGLVIAGRAGRKTAVPYGPAMLAAAVTATVLAALR
ncbi:prepilin peptidase [Micromonospora sp. DT47]|uniref:prepilin peptidase n=1 Tax=Micromonospora sp. DT47 TaxID=3393431 RepID=UPI003CF04054